MKKIAALFLVAVWMGPVGALAEEAAHGHESEHPKNIVGLFAGLTHEGRRDNALALGLEYARHVRGSFSVGGIVEYTSGDDDFWVYAVPFAYTTGHWKMYAAPGIEDGSGGQEALLRLGVERAFELSGNWEVAPQLDVDFVDGEEVWVLGVFFGRKF